MKPRLQLLLYIFFVFCTLLLTNNGYSQINYTQNFEDEDSGWSDDDFFVIDDDEFSCGGVGSLLGNFYYYDGDDPVPAETISPSIGVSNGQPMTVTYSYKLLDYNTFEAVPDVDWGSFYLEYSTSATGPWTVFQTVSQATHISSDACAGKTANFTAPVGSNVYLRLRAEPALIDFTDVFIFFDSLSVIQTTGACSGTPSAVTAVASVSTPICTNTPVTLSFTPNFTVSGLSYQWQFSTNGTAYSNVVTGGTSATYTTTQPVTTWYKVIVTCNGGGGSPTTSTAVQVLSNGQACYCDIEFPAIVEPITRVNFAGINNLSDAEVDGSPSLENFTSLTPGTVTQGQSYPIILEGNTNDDSEIGYVDFFKVYIDFNQNGNLGDAGEGFELGSIIFSNGEDGIQATGSIAIPPTALTGNTRMRVVKNWDDEDTPVYLAVPCGDDNSGYGQAEDYTINIVASAPCTTLPPTATATQNFCNGATVANLTATGNTIKWYAAATGGTVLPATQALVNGNHYFASQTVGCESLTRTDVTVALTTVLVDDLADIATCSEYILPALTNGAYYTAAAGGGIMLEAGDVISETTTLYIHAQAGTTPVCTAETSFIITINNAVADELEDVTACTSYELQELENGAYYTGQEGTGDMLEAGDLIELTTTIYIYDEAGTAPNLCTDENSFIITINNAIVDEPNDVTACTSYELPELENGNYYLTPGGIDLLEDGYVVTETTTIYVYAETATTPACIAESSFIVTINTIEVDDMEDVTACFGYELPELENGAYYTEPGGEGIMLEAGDMIEETGTLYIYAITATTPACIAETSFAVTINAPVPPSGDDTIEFTLNPAGGPSLSEIELDAEGTITWYATEEDAENSEDPLPNDTMIPVGTTTYYATQTIGECESEPFAVTVDVVLGRDDFDTASFSYHPNPVSDVLTLNYSKTITEVTVYNLLGQPVMEKSVSQNNAQIDLSQLAAGTYMVRVQADDASKTIKVVKK